MAGTAGNPISVSHAPQYGDKTVIQRMAKTTTETPMTGNPVQKRGPGRPSTGGPQPQAVGNPAEAQGVFMELARAKKTADFWMMMAESEPNPITRYFSYHAQKAYQEAAKKTYNRTPNFE